MYNSASNRHHQLTDVKVSGSEDEWMALIEEFEAIIDANPSGEWADDAQYAIGSCWIWLSKKTDPVRIQHAIDALEKLLENYPDSPLAADAHYWLGDCHRQLGDDSLAATHYQKVINDYFNHPKSELAQFDLAQIYEKQNNLAVAISMYRSAAERSDNSQIVAQAQERIRSLRLGQASPDSTALEPGAINSLGIKIPSQRRSLASPTDRSLAMPIIAAVPPLKPDDGKVRTKGQSVPQIVLSDDVESASLPSTDSQFEIIAPKIERRKTEPKEQVEHSPVRNIPVENSQADSGINITLPRQLGLQVKTVVIDPGHGGKDPGTTSNSPIHEKNVVLELSLMLRDLLESRGYHVRLTRENDVFLPLRERTRLATMQGADLFISIHANAATRPGASGVETYYLALASDATAQRTAARENSGAGYGIKELDKLVTKILKETKSVESRQLARYIQKELVDSTNAIDRGVKHAPFVVLIGTKVPAVLVEVGFLSHQAEAQKLAKKAYKRNIAEAIARGIDRYVSSSSATAENADGGIDE